MADEQITQNVENEEVNEDVETENAEQTEEQTEEQPQEEEKKFTEDKVNRIVKDRLAKEKKKHENDLNEQVKKNEDLQSQLDEANAELDDLKQEKQIAELKNQIGEETGVSPTILRGNTEEEIREHAEQIKKSYSYPEVKQGENPNAEGFQKSEDQKLIEGLERGNIL